MTDTKRPAKKRAKRSPAEHSIVDTDLDEFPPPAKRGRGSKYEALIEELKAEPGKISKIGPFTGGTLVSTLKAIDPRVEAVSRTEEDGTYIYVRVRAPRKKKS